MPSEIIEIQLISRSKSRIFYQPFLFYKNSVPEKTDSNFTSSKNLEKPLKVKGPGGPKQGLFFLVNPHMSDFEYGLATNNFRGFKVLIVHIFIASVLQPTTLGDFMCLVYMISSVFYILGFERSQQQT